jgi:hypothetical protein
MSIFVRTTDLPILLGRSLVTMKKFGVDLTQRPDYLWDKLIATEADISRRLRCFLEPTEMLPFGYLQSEVDAFNAAGTKWAEEPGYDYNPTMFTGDSWGQMTLRQKPIIAVHSLNFAYPSASQSLYAIPNDWFRIDRKYGQLALIPTQSAVAFSLNGFILSALGGGTTLPYVLQIRYSAGLTDARNQYPDLVDLIYRATILSMVDDAFVAQSGSVSIDGMSQSNSFDPDKYRQAIDDKVEVLRKAIHGIRMMAM